MKASIFSNKFYILNSNCVTLTPNVLYLPTQNVLLSRFDCIIARKPGQQTYTSKLNYIRHL